MHTFLGVLAVILILGIVVVLAAVPFLDLISDPEPEEKK